MTILCLSLAAALALTPYQLPSPRPAGEFGDEKRGLLRGSDTAGVGFILYGPLRSTSTYLIASDGTVAHKWTSNSPPGLSVYLLPNGNLLRCERVNSSVFSGGGLGGRVREYDRDSRVVWEFVCADAQRQQHHDIEPLPNGNLLMIVWTLKSAADALAAGRNPKLLGAQALWPDAVLEVEPMRPIGGRVVWEWHAWDHLVQDYDEKLAGFGSIADSPQRIDVNSSVVYSEPETDELEALRKLGYFGPVLPDRGSRFNAASGADWTHLNSIDYSQDLDMIMLSSRELSELWFIDHSTTTEQAKSSTGGRWGRGGDLLFRWGNPRWIKRDGGRTLFGQHDAQWITAGYPGAGNVLLFNNGESGVRGWSSVDELRVPITAGMLKNTPNGEIDVRVDVVASYSSPDFCRHLSGAQRLPNGNTLVCSGETGRLVVVTPLNEVVWEFLSPYEGSATIDIPQGGRGPGGPGEHDGLGDARAVFRATHIEPSHPGLLNLRR